MGKFYISHKGSSLFSRFIRIKKWQLVLYLFIIANLMTFLLNFIQSYLWWGNINIDLLYIGTIDAAVIVTILGPIFILLTSQITRFEEYRKESEARSEAEQKYRRYIENALDIVTVLDKNGIIKYESPSIEKMLGYNPAEMIGQSVFDFLHPTEKEYAFNLFKDKITENNSSATLELKFLRKNGTWANLITSGRNLLHDNLVDGIVLNSKDITELKESNQKLNNLLEEKKILIKEIHHRVKNNFQSVSSLLTLQAEMVKDDQLKEILNESCNRIHSLALIHEKLQESEDVSNVTLRSYLQRLIDDLVISYKGVKENISVDLNVDYKIELPTNQCVQLGLILNELLSNVFKYAFPDNRHGRVTINFDRKNEFNYFLVSDNGIGLVDGFDISKCSSLGLKIVKWMVDQLRGEISYQNKGGVEFFIKFPMAWN